LHDSSRREIKRTLDEKKTERTKCQERIRTLPLCGPHELSGKCTQRKGTFMIEPEIKDGDFPGGGAYKSQSSHKLARGISARG